MYLYESDIDIKQNKDVMVSLARNLRRTNASRYGLKEKPPSLNFSSGTTLYDRKMYLGYNTHEATPEDTLIFTGQCLLKDEENLDCPITMEDAIECKRLREFTQVHLMPVLCMYPDSTYRAFVSGWSGRDATDHDVERATEAYVKFRQNMVPGMVHVRTSQVEDQLHHAIETSGIDIDALQTKIRRIYGGRTLAADQSHVLQRTIIEYGLKTAILPGIMGLDKAFTIIFAEPDEICSVTAAEIVEKALGTCTKYGLVGQIPVPPINYGNGRVRMYSADRQDRIHLDETDSTIREKFETDPRLLLISLYLSPLTTKDQLEYIGRSSDRLAGMDLMLEQINGFRGFL